MDDWDGPVNYVPHHAVKKPDSLTTALRSVCNSSVNNNGTSLNDLMPKGPNSLNPLLHSMTKFRTHKETVIWDYKKAYLTVHTHEPEMHLRRIVWRFSPEDEWETYGINRMMFGDRPAATALEVTKRKVAELGESIDPEASEMIGDGYVDDGVTGGEDKDLDQMMGERVDPDMGESIFGGTIQQIIGLGGFKLKHMIRLG